MHDITGDNWQAWLLAGSISIACFIGFGWFARKVWQKAKAINKPTPCSTDRTTFWLNE